MLRTTFRFIWLHRFINGINVFGLSIGICSCLLIYLFVQNERAYDQHFEKKKKDFQNCLCEPLPLHTANSHFFKNKSTIRADEIPSNAADMIPPA